MTAGCAIVVRCDSPSNGGPDTQQGKVRSRYKFCLHALGLVLEREAGVERESAEHAGEDLVVVLKIAVHGIGDRVATPVAAVMRPAHGEQHELCRPLYRQQTQQDL